MKTRQYRIMMIIVSVIGISFLIYLAIYNFKDSKSNTGVTFDSIVLQKNEKLLLVYKAEAVNDRLVYLNIENAKIIDAAGNETTIDSIGTGTIISVTYSDESTNAIAPATYQSVTKIMVTNKKDTQLYEKALQESEWHLNSSS